MFIVLSIPVTAPMVFAAEKFSAAMKASPRATRAVDYLFAGVFFGLRAQDPDGAGEVAACRQLPAQRPALSQ